MKRAAGQYDYELKGDGTSVYDIMKDFEKKVSSAVESARGSYPIKVQLMLDVEAE